MAFRSAPWPPIRNAVVSLLEQHRPHTVYGLAEIEIGATLERMRSCQRTLRHAVSLHAYAIYCLSRAASEYSQLQTYKCGRELITFEDVDVGTVLDKRLPSGLRIPVGYVFRGAQKKSLAEINHELRVASRSDLADDEMVRWRRRIAILPAPLRRAVSRRITRDPFWLRRFHGTIGLTNLQSPGLTQPAFGLPPNIYTYTMALGSIAEREAGRKVLCFSGGADHAILDGMSLSYFARRLFELLSSAQGLDEEFVAQSRLLYDS